MPGMSIGMSDIGIASMAMCAAWPVAISHAKPLPTDHMVSRAHWSAIAEKRRSRLTPEC